MMFTMPAPDGLAWKGPAIVSHLKANFGKSKLAELTEAETIECERQVIALMNPPQANGSAPEAA
jgi:hypothetical protein